MFCLLVKRLTSKSAREPASHANSCDQTFTKIDVLRLRLRRSVSVLLYTKPRTWVLEAAKSATLSGARGRTAAT